MSSSTSHQHNDATCRLVKQWRVIYCLWFWVDQFAAPSLMRKVTERTHTHNVPSSFRWHCSGKQFDNLHFAFVDGKVDIGFVFRIVSLNVSLHCSHAATNAAHTVSRWSHHVTGNVRARDLFRLLLTILLVSGLFMDLKVTVTSRLTLWELCLL
jgi:hypothetical protein